MASHLPYGDIIRERRHDYFSNNSRVVNIGMIMLEFNVWINGSVS